MQTPSTTEKLPPFSFRRLAWHLGFILLFAVIMAWAWRKSEINPWALMSNAQNSAIYLKDFIRPDFSHWRQYVDSMMVTLAMALWGSLLAVIAAVPLGLMAASNISPFWLRQIVRRFLDALRSINEMIFAIAFMVAVGLGPFAGMLALFVHTAGVLGKLFSEVVESIDPKPVEGIRAVGANRLQEIIFGVIPQVLPMWISYSLYRFESNVRSATVVGIVGAGGIGYELYELFRTYEFGQVSCMLIIILVTVSIIDIASAQIRKVTV